jgi:hypothetical protein
MNTYIPNEIALQYPISIHKILHFVSQDTQISYTFIKDILQQHVERLTIKQMNGEDIDLSGAYDMQDCIEEDPHNASDIAHRMALQTHFIENDIDNSFNYLMTLLANGCPVPYDTPEIYIRVWCETETIPKYTPIMGRATGFHRPSYTTNRIRGIPNYPQYVNYEDEEFLEKIAIERLPPAAPITHRMRPKVDPEYGPAKSRRSLQDIFDSEFELIQMGSNDELDIPLVQPFSN